MQFGLNLLIVTSPNSTSQSKKTVQTVLILGLFFFSLWVVSCIVWTCGIFCTRIEILHREHPSSPLAFAVHVICFHDTPLLTKLSLIPQTLLPDLSDHPLPHHMAFPVSAPTSPLANPTVRPYGTWLSPSEPLLVLFLLPLLCQNQIRPFLSNSNVPASMETLWSPSRKESAPLCAPFDFTDLALQDAALPVSCQSYLVCSFLSHILLCCTLFIFASLKGPCHHSTLNQCTGWLYLQVVQSPDSCERHSPLRCLGMCSFLWDPTRS